MKNRRAVLTGAAATMAAFAANAATTTVSTASASAADSSNAKASAGTGRARRVLDFRNPIDNLYALVKMHGTFGPKAVYPAYRGITFGRVGQAAAKPLFGYEGFSTLRADLLPNGHVRWWGKEIAFYTDLRTGLPLDRWVNPYTNETVEPMHFLNDHQLAVLTDTMLEIRFPGQEDEEPAGTFYNPHLTAADRRKSDGTLPFVLPWTVEGDLAMVTLEAPLSYKNPLDPKVWKRESSGDRINPSESYSFTASLADLENPQLQSANFTGGFARVAPWWPWMLMGQHPGDLFTRAHMWKRTDSLDNVQPTIRRYVEKRHPEYLEPPTEWDEERNPSTWEKYALTRKPAA